jgi:hypothetical protein
VQTVVVFGWIHAPHAREAPASYGCKVGCSPWEIPGGWDADMRLPLLLYFQDNRRIKSDAMRTPCLALQTASTLGVLVRGEFEKMS